MEKPMTITICTKYSGRFKWQLTDVHLVTYSTIENTRAIRKTARSTFHWMV